MIMYLANQRLGVVCKPRLEGEIALSEPAALVNVL